MSILFIIAGIMTVLILAALVVTFSIKFDEDHSAECDAWHIKLYRFLGAEHKYADFPKSVCEYFWKYFVRIITLPFTFVAIILAYIFPDNLASGNRGERYGLSLAAWLILVISTFWGWGTLDEPAITLGNIWGMMGLGLLILFVGCGVIVGLVFGVAKICEYFDNKPKKPSLLVSRIKSWKEKNCPRINWK